MHQVDVRVAELSVRQHGVFTRTQAVEVGASRKMIQTRLESERWVRRHPGVYRLAGTPVTWLGELAAACHARPGAIVSHESAGTLHRMRYVPRDVLSIISPRSARSLRGVAVHQPRRISSDQIVTIDGLPVTSRAVTIIDLASVLSRGRLERVLDDQLSSHKVTLEEAVLAFEMQARRGKKGIAVARLLLEQRLGGLAASESELEHLFRERVEPHLRHPPTYQFRPSWRTDGVGRADVGFPEFSVLAELDGRRWHLRDADFESDHRRDQEALERKWRTVRYTYRQIKDDPLYVARNLHRILEPAA